MSVDELNLTNNAYQACAFDGQNEFFYGARTRVPNTLPTVIIDIISVLYGDVNGDGRVNAFDVTALVLWINAGRPADTIDEIAARITGTQGQPKAFDVTALVLWINAGGGPLVGHPGPNS